MNRNIKTSLAILAGILLITCTVQAAEPATAVLSFPEQKSQTSPVVSSEQAYPEITGITSTESGLRITWNTLNGADKYIVYRSSDNSRPEYIIDIDSVVSVPQETVTESVEELWEAISKTEVTPASPPIIEYITDSSGTVTGYAYTDPLILPGKEYHYYVRGYHAASGTFSSYDKDEPPVVWNITPSEIRAGTRLTEEAVELLGVDNFFYVEEISDELFERMWLYSYKDYCTVPRENLRYIRCLHKNMEGEIKVGELVMSVLVADSVCDIFRQLYEASYPIESMLLVDDFLASDELSIMHNNTSAFNYRTVDNTTQISDHAYGLAIDINPYYNVYYIPSANYIFPQEGWEYLDRNSDFPYILKEGDLCYTLFLEAGFYWGGWYTYNIDYQHFYYPGY